MLCELLLTAAFAQQPLETFLAGAADAGTDVRLADADVDIARARRGKALGAWLPRVQASAGYTRNQLAVEASFPDGNSGFETVTISALDQLDATARIDVPLFDLPGWTRWVAANASLRAARERASSVEQNTIGAVTTTWYRLVAARAILAAARKALETAEQTARFVEQRKTAGLASSLDGDRASADVGRAEEGLANAELEAALAERQLVVLTGIDADDTTVTLTNLDREEAPLDDWTVRVDTTPDVQSASLQARAAKTQRTAAGTSLLPSVGAFATERWTNAAGFGPQALWSAGVQATWSLDVGRAADVRDANATMARARINERAARDQVESAIHTSWHRVRALSKRLEASRRSELALTRAALVTADQFENGTASQLDLSAAERDRFQAEVDRIRVSADLMLERRLLRLHAGLPPDVSVNP